MAVLSFTYYRKKRKNGGQDLVWYPECRKLIVDKEEEEEVGRGAGLRRRSSWRRGS